MTLRRRLPLAWLGGLGLAAPFAYAALVHHPWSCAPPPPGPGPHTLICRPNVLAPLFWLPPALTVIAILGLVLLVFAGRPPWRVAA